jgi:CopG family nickel-responsive transcriptional regulator
MQRVTITLDDDLMADLDKLIEERGYQNRSEAIRDLTRAGIQQTALETEAGGECVAAVAYLYDHGARELAKRLTNTYHDHQTMSLATLHVHLDPANCLEVTVLRGDLGEVRHFAEHVVAERGVKHGRLIVMPIGRLGHAPHSDAAAREKPGSTGNG